HLDRGCAALLVRVAVPRRRGVRVLHRARLALHPAVEIGPRGKRSENEQQQENLHYEKREKSGLRFSRNALIASFASGEDRRSVKMRVSSSMVAASVSP